MMTPFVLARPSANLVFALDWFPLVGTRADKIANRIARQHHATHMVLSDESAGAVGIARIVDGKRRNRPLFSAAQNVAQLFPGGTIALTLELEGQGIWFVAIHEKAVVARTDRLFDSQEDAGAALAELHQAYPQLVVLGAGQSPPVPTLEAIEAVSASHSAMRRTSRWRPLLPLPVQCFAAAIVLVVLFPHGQKLLRSQPAASISSTAPNPYESWQSAIAKAALGHSVDGQTGTRALLKQFHALPMRVGGWSLQKAECAAEQRHWACYASFLRKQAGADNQSFLQHADPNWVVEFQSLEDSVVRWRAARPSRPLLGHPLASASANERYLLSALQSIQAGFAQLKLSKPQPLGVIPPTTPQGGPVPRPAGLPSHSLRTVHVSGPLRSVGLLVPSAAGFSWSRATLSVSNTDKPDLKNSRLNLSLQGTLHEADLPTMPTTAIPPGLEQLASMAPESEP